jgi:hypothetical protein
VPIVLKSGSLKLLEPSGPVQACNGIALTFTFAIAQNVFARASWRLDFVHRWLSNYLQSNTFSLQTTRLNNDVYWLVYQ